MRVIAGEARSVPLVTPTGKGTRPTSDRIKETLFNIIQYDIPGSTFLDLFAGSGGVGIEAISRGGKKAVFVDMAREAIGCIQANLSKTKFEDRAVVLPMEATYSISKLERQGECFDIIFIDPPYQTGLDEKILQLIAQSKIVKEEALVIIETSIKDDILEFDEDVFTLERVKNYKTNRHIFLRRK